MSFTTYQDIQEHALDYLGGTADAQALRDARRAALEAYRDLAHARTWSFLSRHGRILTQAPYLTGTIAYTHTGGLYERMVTLSGGTWPSWAGPGSNVRVGVVTSQVAERRSGTVLTLSPEVNFEMDLDIQPVHFTGLAFGGAQTITGLTHAMPAVLTVVGHGLTTGDVVLVKNVGTTNTANPIVTTNGTWTVTVVDADTCSLQTSDARSDTTWDLKGTLVRFPAGKAISALTRATPAVATSAGHGLSSGNAVVVSGVLSAASTPVVTTNGTWIVTVIDANTFSLNGSKATLDTTYSATGVFWRPDQVTATAHGLVTGTAKVPTEVVIEGVKSSFLPALSRVVNANGTWAITVIDANTFVLNGSLGMLDTTWDTTTGTYRPVPTTTYTLYQDSYPLPDDFVAQDTAVYEGNFGGLTYSDPTAALWFERYTQSAGTPRWYTIVGNPLFPGKLTLLLSPFPTLSKTIDFIYLRRPRPLTIAAYVAGTISTVAGSALVTGNGTAWQAGMAGSILRLGTPSQVPTSPISTAPATFETVILEVLTPTSLRTADPVPTTLASLLYTISDPVDFEVGAMMTAFLRGVEKQLSIARTLQGKPDAFAAYATALKEAQAADSRSFQGRSMGPQRDHRVPYKYMPSSFFPPTS